MQRRNRILLGLALGLGAILFSRLAGGALNTAVTFFQQVTPGEAHPGDVVTVTGYALDAAHLKEIYLTDGQIDYQVEILDQSEASVRLRVPAKIPAGQMRFAIIVAGRPELLEEPLFLKILPQRG
ncbi:MAG TPA: hypothetical protein VH639_12190 [Bryobacteraceae bacterium]|jgi:hypothetical protein